MFYGVAKLLASIDLKIQLYIKIMRHVITYGVELWHLRKSDERKH